MGFFKQTISNELLMFSKWSLNPCSDFLRLHGAVENFGSQSLGRSADPSPCTRSLLSLSPPRLCPCLSQVPPALSQAPAQSHTRRLPMFGLVWPVRAQPGGRCRMKMQGIAFPGNLVKSQAESSWLVASGALRKTRAELLHPLSSHPQLISGLPLGGHLKNRTSDRTSN